MYSTQGRREVYSYSSIESEWCAYNVAVARLRLIQCSAFAKRDDEHRRQVLLQYRSAASQQEQETIQNQEGTRDPVLSHLSYYDTIRMGLFDAAHCLLLGMILKDHLTSRLFVRMPQA